MESALVKKLEIYVSQKARINIKSKAVSTTSQYLYDLSAVIVLAEYYISNSHENFSIFIKNINIVNILKKYPWMKSIYKYQISQLKNLNKLHKSKKVEILGDPHPNELTRYKLDKKVFSHLPSKTPFFEVSNLLKITNENELSKNFPSLRPLKKSIYFREYLRANDKFKQKKSLNSYYYTFGRCLGYLLLLRSIDNYYENVIISKESPIFFDHECILTNKISGESKKPYGFEHTGTINPKGKDHDTSSLTGATGEIQTLLKPYFIGSEKKPEIKWIINKKIKARHIPEFNGELVNPRDYKKEIISGLLESQKRIINKRKQIIKYIYNEKSITRVLIRPSSFYKSLLVGYPYYFLKEKLEIQEYFQSELKQNKPILENFALKDEIVNYEVDSLIKGYIPMFFQDIHDGTIIDSFGNKVSKFKVTSKSLWLKYFDRFDDVINETVKRLKSLN